MNQCSCDTAPTQYGYGTVQFVVQIPLPRDARNLIDRLLCDVDDRLGSNGVQELKVHSQ